VFFSNYFPINTHTTLAGTPQNNLLFWSLDTGYGQINNTQSDSKRAGCITVGVGASVA
jgi:hypothetical protein